MIAKGTRVKVKPDASYTFANCVGTVVSVSYDDYITVRFRMGGDIYDCDRNFTIYDVDIVEDEKQLPLPSGDKRCKCGTISKKYLCCDCLKNCLKQGSYD